MTAHSSLVPDATTIPLACVPGAIPESERSAHFALIRSLFGADGQTRREVVNGYAFRLSPDDLDSVAAFVRNERRCCPFLRFSIEIGPGDGPLWVTLSGPEGIQQFLAAEFGFDVERTGSTCCSPSAP